MGPAKLPQSPPTPSDIAELQRDCHPFPAYVDFIQGQPTEYELTHTPPAIPAPPQFHGFDGSRAAGPLRNSAGPPAYPNPPQSLDIRSRPSLFRDGLSDQRRSMPAARPAGPPSSTLPNPLPLPRQPPMLANQVVGPPPSMPTGASNVGSSGPKSPPSSLTSMSVWPAPVQAARLLQRDDLLKSGYAWLPPQSRAAMNARVGHLRDVAENKNVPANGRAVAMKELTLVSMQIDNQLREWFFPRIHSLMPTIYDAMKLREQWPDHPAAAKAGQWIQKMVQALGSAWQYVTRLLGEMNKKRAEGKVAYEAIPGWLDNWLKTQAQQDANQKAAPPGGEAEQSKGESSPLPEWKGC